MKTTTTKLLEKIDENHDWTTGQTYSNGGTSLVRTDTCRVCLLQRHWKDDSQNDISDEYTFTDGENGAQLSLRQAVSRGCLESTGN